MAGPPNPVDREVVFLRRTSASQSKQRVRLGTQAGMRRIATY